MCDSHRFPINGLPLLIALPAKASALDRAIPFCDLAPKRVPAASGAEFDFLFRDDELKALFATLQALGQDTDAMAASPALALFDVQVESAQASKARDEEMIKKSIQRTDGGFDRLNYVTGHQLYRSIEKLMHEPGQHPGVPVQMALQMRFMRRVENAMFHDASGTCGRSLHNLLH